MSLGKIAIFSFIGLGLALAFASGCGPAWWRLVPSRRQGLLHLRRPRLRERASTHQGALPEQRGLRRRLGVHDRRVRKEVRDRHGLPAR